MSRVAKKPVYIPQSVDCGLEASKVTLKGKLGILSIDLADEVEVLSEQIDGAMVLKVAPRNNSIKSKAIAGTTKVLLQNSVLGVDAGFEKALELKGVGYRCQVQGNKINLTLGFSHPCEYVLPEGVSATSSSPTQLVVKGADKQLVGQVAADIRGFRPPEPYKGKGVRYLNETIAIREVKKK